jgi:two-component system, cell cycle sensor histidine kinase and response regulator CckA
MANYLAEGLQIPSQRGGWVTVPAGPQMQTVLVVEDAEPLRKMIVSMLQTSGYNVLEASNGADALLVFEREGEHIDLVLTDVIMPQMNGKELADRLSLLRQDCPIVFMSGYVEDPLVERVMNVSTHFLRKPFTAQALTDMIRRNLERGRAVGERPPSAT